MCYPRVKCRASQAGAALVVAMLVFALVAALMVGLQRDFSLMLQRGTHQLFSEQAWSYLIGAEGLAELALRADSRIDARTEQPSDHLGEVWAQPPTLTHWRRGLDARRARGFAGTHQPKFAG